MLVLLVLVEVVVEGAASVLVVLLWREQRTCRGLGVVTLLLLLRQKSACSMSMSKSTALDQE